ncbi:MAG TPA: hypothetical protein ENJ97_06440, partial [Planctomycetes bacterium]|nr:hypothetical protein [Planctomycetota bacterium]
KPGPLVLGKKAFLWGVDGTHGWEPWVTDGTAGGTRLLWDTYPGRRSPDDPEWVKAGKKVFFIAGVKSDRSFWVSDLTPSGTKPLAQKLVVCRNLVALGSRALFEAKKGPAAGLEPWISDGTPGGTGMLIDLAPGFQDGGFQAPFVLGDKVYFFGTDGKTVSFGKKGLFETDGTPGGTKRVGTWETDRAPSRACVVGGRAVFWARDPAHGMEPWVTDGTAPGTVLLADLAPGPDSTSDVSFLPMGRRKGVFVFQGPSREKNLLVTDGTPAGSFVLPSPRPGVPLKASGVLAFSGGKLFFGADDGFTGTEPWAWFPGATAQAVGWSQGGARLDGEDPVLGGKFRLTVTGIPKGGAGILLLGKPLSRPLLLGGGAALFLDAAARPLVGFSLGASGSPAFALPGDPALIGARLAAQAVVGPTRTRPFNLDFTNGLFLTLGD